MKRVESCVEFTKRFIRLRRHYRLKVKDVAMGLNVTAPKIYRLEKGHGSLDVVSLQRLVGIMPCNLNWLIAGEGASGMRGLTTTQSSARIINPQSGSDYAKEQERLWIQDQARWDVDLLTLLDKPVCCLKGVIMSVKKRYRYALELLIAQRANVVFSVARKDIRKRSFQKLFVDHDGKPMLTKEEWDSLLTKEKARISDRLWVADCTPGHNGRLTMTFRLPKPEVGEEYRPLFEAIEGIDVKPSHQVLADQVSRSHESFLEQQREDEHFKELVV